MNQQRLTMLQNEPIETNKKQTLAPIARLNHAQAHTND
jgi:hypothetical protein